MSGAGDTCCEKEGSCVRSVRSQMSMVPSTPPMKNTPGRLGDQQPHERRRVCVAECTIGPLCAHVHDSVNTLRERRLSEKSGEHCWCARAYVLALLPDGELPAADAEQHVLEEGRPHERHDRPVVQRVVEHRLRSYSRYSNIIHTCFILVRTNEQSRIRTDWECAHSVFCPCPGPSAASSRRTRPLHPTARVRARARYGHVHVLYSTESVCFEFDLSVILEVEYVWGEQTSVPQ